MKKESNLKGFQRFLEILVVYTSSSSSSSSGASDSEVSEVDASDEPVVGSIPENIVIIPGMLDKKCSEDNQKNLPFKSFQV